MSIYAFGATPDGHVRAPTQIYPGPVSSDDAAEARVAFHSWTHTVLHTSRGLLELPDTLLSPSAQVVGSDKPLALLEGGRLRLLSAPVSPPPDSAEEWDAIAPTDVGPALAVRHGAAYALPTLTSPGTRLNHPLLRGRCAVVASESRAAILVGGEVLEALWDWRRPEERVPRLEVVEEIAGLGVTRLVAGRGNRLGVVTEAGEGYVLEPGVGGSGEVRRIELGDGGEDEERSGEAEGKDEGGEGDDEQTGQAMGGEEEGDDDAPEVEDGRGDNYPDSDDDERITDLALGPDFELVLSDGVVWARGNNDFGQLGQGHTRAVDGWVRVPLPPESPARRVFAGRFSAVVECEERP